MRYIEARIAEKREADIYRIYLTDCLQMIAENTSKFAGGRYIPTRFMDLITPQNKKNEPSGSEIVAELTTRLKLSFGKGDS